MEVIFELFKNICSRSCSCFHWQRAVLGGPGVWLGQWELHLHHKCEGSTRARMTARGEGPSRWWMSKTWRSTSSPLIYVKCIYMWNNSYRTPTECWQKTSDFTKGKKFPKYLAVWLTGSWCSCRVSGLSLGGGRDNFRTLDHQRPPGPM